MELATYAICALGGIVLIYGNVFADVHRDTALWINCLGAIFFVIGGFAYAQDLLWKKDAATDQVKEHADPVQDALEITQQILANLTSRTDILTKDAQDKLIARLSTLPNASVSLQVMGTDEETRSFGTLIEDILSEANCLGGVIRIAAFDNTGLIPARGVEIVAVEGAPQDVSQLLYDSLVAAGIPDVRVVPVQTQQGRGVRDPIRVESHALLLRILPK